MKRALLVALALATFLMTALPQTQLFTLTLADPTRVMASRTA
jgi:hypothetical protein